MFNIEKMDPILTPQELLDKLPASPAVSKFVKNSRKNIENILSGKDKRFLIILGPCSIHDVAAAKDYAQRLKKLSDEVSSHLLLVMRVYVDKPRTTIGWKGLLHDPHLNGSNDMNLGLELGRRLLIDLAEIGVPAAMEFLELMSPNYFADLISWGSIGARTSASQPHRQIASLLQMPVGFKNAVDGDVTVAVQGALVARCPHTFMNINPQGQVAQVRSKGNPFAHIVLRGGGGRPNYDAESVAAAMSLLEETLLPKELLIDCSHGNCTKDYTLQNSVFHAIIDQVAAGNKHIVGTLLESHINAGNQSHKTHAPLKYAVSLTDPCIDWETTVTLIQSAYKKFSSRESFSLAF